MSRGWCTKSGGCPLLYPDEHEPECPKAIDSTEASAVVVTRDVAEWTAHA